jgi:uncharacterized protein
MLTEQDRADLLLVARSAILARLSHAVAPSWPEREALLGPAGAFVTLRCGGELRGCIGDPLSALPLVRVVADCAVAAATTDPRFLPLTLDELSLVELEISVLGPLELVPHPREIEVGRHGVLVEQGPLRGLLLPQVALEQGWDRQMLLQYACLKAGLPGDAWTAGARIFRFEAEIFGEHGSPQGL